MNIKDVLNDISNSFSTPEAQHLHQLVVEQDFEKTAKLLKKKFPKGTDAEQMIDVLYKNLTQKYKLVEVSLQEIDVKDEEQNYIFLFGGSFTRSNIMEYHSQKCFFDNCECVSIEKAIQIWKVVNYGTITKIKE